MKKKAVTVCALASLLFIAGCGEPPKPDKIEVEGAKIDYIEQEAPMVPYKQVGEIENVSYGDVRRFSARIVVPDGLSSKQLTEMLTDAVKAVTIKYNANAAMVFAFRTKDKDIATSTWTVGRAVYAPNGEWGDAAENAEKKTVVQLGKIYFQPEKANTLKSGSKTTLTSENETPIEVSRSRDVWLPDQIIAKIPSGTSVIILERYEKALTSEFIFARYRIKASYQEKEIEGWVFEEDVLK